MSMNARRLFLSAAAFGLLVSFSAGAMAQSTTGTDVRLPPEPYPPITTVSAIEVTDGTIGYNSRTREETVFGYSFLGRTSGAFPGSFTLSMNCTPPLTPPVGPVGSSDITAVGPMVPAPIQVSGGTWTLPVYLMHRLSDGYAGSLYGTIVDGTMNWDSAGTNCTVYLVLNINGGTLAWEGSGGYATFSGTLSVDETTRKTTLNGTLVFDIIGVSP
jgi:hypothetical protein